MKGLKVSPEGRNVLGYRILFNSVTGFGGEVAPPFARIYGGGENDIRGFDIRSASPYTFIPTRVELNLTNPDGSLVPRDPSNPTLGTNVQVPLPVYRLASIGGDTNFTANLEYRIPIVSQVTFSLFTDFGMTFNSQPGQLRQSVLGISALNAPLYGCPNLINGNCVGGTQVNFPLFLKTVPGTNYVPRMSNGAEISLRPAHRQRALPHLLRLQPAASLQEHPAGIGDLPHCAPTTAPHSRTSSRSRVHLVPLLTAIRRPSSSTAPTTCCVSRARPSASQSRRPSNLT